MNISLNTKLLNFVQMSKACFCSIICNTFLLKEKNVWVDWTAVGEV